MYWKALSIENIDELLKLKTEKLHVMRYHQFANKSFDYLVVFADIPSIVEEIFHT